MVTTSKRWTIKDRYGNEIYLTQERWQHLIEPTNHPEMSAFEEHLKDTVRKGARKQDSLNPAKYRYTLAFDDLVEDNTHIVAIVLFHHQAGAAELAVPNNYVVTAFQKENG